MAPNTLDVKSGFSSASLWQPDQSSEKKSTPVCSSTTVQREQEPLFSQAPKLNVNQPEGMIPLSRLWRAESRVESAQPEIPLTKLQQDAISERRLSLQIQKGLLTLVALHLSPISLAANRLQQFKSEALTEAKFALENLKRYRAEKSPKLEGYVAAKAGVEVDPLLEPLKEEVRGLEKFVQHLENLSISGNEESVRIAIREEIENLIEFELKVNRWLLHRQIERLDAIPVDGKENSSGLLERWESFQSSSYTLQDRFIAYEQLRKEIGWSVLNRTVEGRIFYLNQMVKPVRVKDRVDRFARAWVNMESPAEGNNQNWYHKVAAEYRVLKDQLKVEKKENVSLEKAQKEFAEFETNRSEILEALQENYQSDSDFIHLSVGVGMIAASAGVGLLLRGATLPLLTRALGGAALREGTFTAEELAARLLLATRLSHGVDAFGFVLGSRAIENTVMEESFFILDPKKSLLLNFAEIGHETVRTYLLIKTIQFAVGGFVNKVDEVMIRQAEKRVATELKIEISAVGPEHEEILFRHLKAIRDSQLTQLGLKIGSFGAEFVGLKEFEALSVLHDEKRLAQILSVQSTKETLYFLVGLKCGNLLFSPVTKPLHDWVKEQALAPFQSHFEAIDQRIKTAGERMDPANHELFNPIEALQIYEEALIKRIQILEQLPEEIRDAQQLAIAKAQLAQIQNLQAGIATEADSEGVENQSIPPAYAASEIPAPLSTEQSRVLAVSASTPTPNVWQAITSVFQGFSNFIQAVVRNSPVGSGPTILHGLYVTLAGTSAADSAESSTAEECANKVRGIADPDERYLALHALVGHLRENEKITEQADLLNRVTALFGGRTPYDDDAWERVAPGMNVYHIEDVIRHSETPFAKRRADSTLHTLLTNLFEGNALRCARDLIEIIESFSNLEGGGEFILLKLRTMISLNEGIPSKDPEYQDDPDEMPVNSAIIGEITSALLTFPFTLQNILENLKKESGNLPLIERFYRVTPNVEKYLQDSQKAPPHDLTEKVVQAVKAGAIGRNDYVLTINLQSVDGSYVYVDNHSGLENYLLAVKIEPEQNRVNVFFIPPSSNPYKLYEVGENQTLIPIQARESDTIDLPKVESRKTVSHSYPFAAELSPGKTYQFGPFKFTVPDASKLKGVALPEAPTFQHEVNLVDLLRQKGASEVEINRGISAYHKLPSSSEKTSYAVVLEDGTQYHRIKIIPIDEVRSSMPIVAYFHPSIDSSGFTAMAVDPQIREASKVALASVEYVEYPQMLPNTAIDLEVHKNKLIELFAPFSFLKVDEITFFDHKGLHYARIPYVPTETRIIDDPERSLPVCLVVLLGQFQVTRFGELWGVSLNTDIPPRIRDPKRAISPREAFNPEFKRALYRYYASQGLDETFQTYGKSLDTLQQNLNQTDYTMNPEMGSTGFDGTMNLSGPVGKIRGSIFYLNIFGGPFIDKGSSWSTFPENLRAIILHSFPREVMVQSIYARIVREIDKDLKNHSSLQKQYIGFVTDWHLLPADLQAEALQKLPEPMRVYWNQMILSQVPSNVCESSESAR